MNLPPRPLAVCYARQSKTAADELAAGESLSSETQIAKAEQFAGVHEWAFDGELSRGSVDLDTSGGAKAKHRKTGTPTWQRRPGLMRIYEAAKSGKIQHLICYKLDRLGRDAAELHQIRDAFHDAAAVIHIVSEGIRSDTPGGELVFGVLASVAQMERRQISDRIRDVSLQRARRGYHHSREPGWIVLVPGTTPADGIVHYALHPVHSETLRRIIALRLEGRTMAEIAREMNSEGRTNTLGTTWVASSVVYALSANNRLRYRGCAVYGRKLSDGDPLRVVTTGVFPQLIDAPTSDALDAVQEALEARAGACPGLARSRTTPYRQTDFLLRGVLRCAICDALMQTQINGGRSTEASRAAGTSVKRRSYQCRDAATSDVIHPGSSHPNRKGGMQISAERSERAVLDALNALQKRLWQLGGKSIHTQSKPRKKVKAATPTPKRTVAEVTESIDRLFELLEQGKVSPGDYDRMYAARVAEREQIELYWRSVSDAQQITQAADSLRLPESVGAWDVGKTRLLLAQLVERIDVPVMIEGVRGKQRWPEAEGRLLEHVRIVLRSPIAGGVTSILSGMYDVRHTGDRRVVFEDDGVETAKQQGI